MPAQRIGEHIFVHFRKVVGHREAAPAARHAGNAADDDVGADEPGVHRRGQGQDGAGGVAAGVGHQPRRADFLPVQLGQPIDGLVQQPRLLMLHAVPFGVFLGLFQPEIGADVHHFHAVPQRRNAGLGAGLVGQGGKHQIEAARQLRLDGEAQAGQVGEHLGQRLPGGAAPGDRGDFHLRVAVQDAGQFRAGIAGNIDDANLHLRNLLPMDARGSINYQLSMPNYQSGAWRPGGGSFPPPHPAPTPSFPRKRESTPTHQNGKADRGSGFRPTPE